MSDIVAFLEARVNEAATYAREMLRFATETKARQEARAERAFRDSPSGDVLMATVGEAMTDPAIFRAMMPYMDGQVPPPNSMPAILARCEADRRIIALTRYRLSLCDGDELIEALKLRALEWRDHPGYDPAWNLEETE